MDTPEVPLVVGGSASAAVDWEQPVEEVAAKRRLKPVKAAVATEMEEEVTRSPTEAVASELEVEKMAVVETQPKQLQTVRAAAAATQKEAGEKFQP